MKRCTMRYGRLNDINLRSSVLLFTTHCDDSSRRFDMVNKFKTRYDQQQEYIGLAVTWRGRPAKIVRTESDQCGGTFAAIAPLDPDYGEIEYSWAAIYNIVDNHNGEFE